MIKACATCAKQGKTNCIAAACNAAYSGWVLDGPADSFMQMYTRQRVHWHHDRQRYSVQDPTEIHSILCLSIIREVAEVLDCVDWKLHRSKPAKPREELLEEMIDVFKFWMCLAAHHGLTVAEIVNMFNKKSDIVEERARNENNVTTA
jgi:hypothetical protein